MRDWRLPDLPDVALVPERKLRAARYWLSKGHALAEAGRLVQVAALELDLSLWRGFGRPK